MNQTSMAKRTGSSGKRLKAAEKPQQVRQRGSHVIMQRVTEGNTTTVPVQRQLRIGTLRSIIRQSGIPRAEFESD